MVLTAIAASALCAVAFAVGVVAAKALVTTLLRKPKGSA